MMKIFAAALISTCVLAAESKAPEIADIMKGGATYGYKRTGKGAAQEMQIQTTLSVETLGDSEIINADANYFAFACFKSWMQSAYECSYARFRGYTFEGEVEMEIEATRTTGFTGTKNGRLSDDLGGEDRIYNYIDPKSKTVEEGSLNCIAEPNSPGHVCRSWNDRSSEEGSDAFRLNLKETKMNRTSASVVIETGSRTQAVINQQIKTKLGGTQRGYVGVRF